VSGRKSVSHGSIVLLDACCLLNFYAAGCCEAIAEALGCSFVIAEAVSKEALYILRKDTAEESTAREAVDLSGLIGSGILSIVSLAEAERTAFLAFAGQVDDGEAATCALAIHRRLPLATDDRKARRLLQAQAGAPRLYSTIEVLKIWAEYTQANAVTLARTLITVRDRGNFLPPRGEPLREWWEAGISALKE